MTPLSKGNTDRLKSVWICLTFAGIRAVAMPFVIWRTTALQDSIGIKPTWSCDVWDENFRSTKSIYSRSDKHKTNLARATLVGILGQRYSYSSRFFAQKS